MPEKSLIVKKHSAFVQISVKNLTLIQRKMINSLMYLAQKENNCDKKIYRTTIHSLKEMCKIDSTENVDLKAQLKKLSQITIEFNYLNKDKHATWECMSLLASSKIVKDTNIIEFEFSWALLGKIINPSIYAPLNVRLISNLKSSYSIILYEFLRDYLDSPVMPLLTIKEFKELMGIKEHEYKFFPNFKKWALDVAVKEINAKMDIHCDYTLIKKGGNKYSYIQFTAEKKKSTENFIKEIDIEPIPQVTIIELPIIPEKEKNSILETPKINPAAAFQKEEKQQEGKYFYKDILKDFDCSAVRKIITNAEKEHDQKYVETNIRYCVDFAIRKTEEGKMKGTFQGLLSKAMKENYGADYVYKKEKKNKADSQIEKFIEYEKEAQKWFKDFSKKEKENVISEQLKNKWGREPDQLEMKVYSSDQDLINKAYNKFLKDEKGK